MEKSFPVFITESELEIIIGNTSNKFLRIYFSQLFILRMRLDELLRESDKGV